MPKSRKTALAAGAILSVAWLIRKSKKFNPFPAAAIAAVLDNAAAAIRDHGVDHTPPPKPSFLSLFSKKKA